MATVRRETVVDLSPQQAFSLWTDTSRWPTFIDGFAAVEQVEGTWPDEGSKLVWRSIPAGRGRVTEKVLTSEPPARLRTRVFEDRLAGTQTVRFEPIEPGRTGVELVLEYELAQSGPLRFLTDLLFIRRAQGDALARTLRRFGIEAAEQAAL